MLRFPPRSRVIARVIVVAVVCACASSDPTGSNFVVNGTMSGALSDYGPWMGQKTVTASTVNGSLKIIGEDVNFKKITLFLAGIDINAAPTTPDTIAITPENANLTGYAEFAEEYQTGIYQYNTFEFGHATVVLTHVGQDKITGTFSFEVHRFPTGAPLPGAGSSSTRTLTGGAFDIRPTTSAQ